MCKNRRCQVCNSLILSTSIAVAGDNLVINIPATVLNNRQKVCLLLAQTVPAGGGTLPVVITDGTTTIGVVRPDGNYVRADQVRARLILNMTIATTPPTAIVRNACCLAGTAFVQPQITAATTAVTRAAE